VRVITSPHLPTYYSIKYLASLWIFLLRIYVFPNRLLTVCCNCFYPYFLHPPPPRDLLTFHLKAHSSLYLSIVCFAFFLDRTSPLFSEVSSVSSSDILITFVCFFLLQRFHTTLVHLFSDELVTLSGWPAPGELVTS